MPEKQNPEKYLTEKTLALMTFSRKNISPKDICPNVTYSCSFDLKIKEINIFFSILLTIYLKLAENFKLLWQLWLTLGLMLLGLMFFRENVIRANITFGQMSIRAIVFRAKVFGKTFFGQMFFGKTSAHPHLIWLKGYKMHCFNLDICHLLS